MRRRWWAGTGEGAFTSFRGDTRAISVSGVDEVGSASLSFSDLTTGWDERRSRFVDLTDAVWRVRGYGDFWSYCLVAEGAVDIAVEPEVKLWDLAPLDVLVREAGGSFTNLEGRRRPPRRQRGGDQRPAPRTGADLAVSGVRVITGSVSFSRVRFGSQRTSPTTRGCRHDQHPSFDQWVEAAPQALRSGERRRPSETQAHGDLRRLALVTPLLGQEFLDKYGLRDPLNRGLRYGVKTAFSALGASPASSSGSRASASPPPA